MRSVDWPTNRCAPMQAPVRVAGYLYRPTAAPIDPSRQFSWELAAGVGALAEARKGFEQWLADQAVDGEHSEDLVVVLSELAANAAAADGGQDGPIAIRSWRAADEVVLEVENPPHAHDVDIVVPVDGDPLRGCGRGLLIVAAYTDKVEVISPGPAKGLTVRCRKQV